MSRLTVALGAIVVLAGGQARAALNWDIYGDAVIADGDVYNVVRIYDTPPGRTSVGMTGGLIDAAGAHDSSTFNVSGGHIYSLSVNGSSTGNVSGHAFMYRAGAHDLSTLNVSGGDLGGITATGYSMVNISGGSIGGITVGQDAMINMNGGEVTGYSSLEVLGAAVVNLRGGNLSVIYGDSRGEPFAGAINIYGYSLVKTSDGTPYGGYVSGFWFDDTAFNIYVQGSYVYARTNLIPEPCTLCLLSLGGLVVMNRRQ